MMEADFLAAMESELCFDGIAFDRSELLAWTASMWPCINDDPDAGRWARVFARAVRADVYIVECTGGGGE